MSLVRVRGRVYHCDECRTVMTVEFCEGAKFTEVSPEVLTAQEGLAKTYGQASPLGRYVHTEGLCAECYEAVVSRTPALVATRCFIADLLSLKAAVNEHRNFVAEEYGRVIGPVLRRTTLYDLAELDPDGWARFLLAVKQGEPDNKDAHTYLVQFFEKTQVLMAQQVHPLLKNLDSKARVRTAYADLVRPLRQSVEAQFPGVQRLHHWERAVNRGENLDVVEESEAGARMPVPATPDVRFFVRAQLDREGIRASLDEIGPEALWETGIQHCLSFIRERIEDLVLCDHADIEAVVTADFDCTLASQQLSFNTLRAVERYLCTDEYFAEPERVSLAHYAAVCDVVIDGGLRLGATAYQVSASTSTTAMTEVASVDFGQLWGALKELHPDGERTRPFGAALTAFTEPIRLLRRMSQDLLPPEIRDHDDAEAFIDLFHHMLVRGFKAEFLFHHLAAERVEMALATERMAHLLADARNVTDLDALDTLVGAPTNAHPWPSNRHCLCGLSLTASTYCCDPNRPIPRNAFPESLPGDYRLVRPCCGQAFRGFRCDRCARLYTWQFGVVDGSMGQVE